jgi:hypothetical protein
MTAPHATSRHVFLECGLLEGGGLADWLQDRNGEMLMPLPDEVPALLSGIVTVVLRPSVYRFRLGSW